MVAKLGFDTTVTRRGEAEIQTELYWKKWLARAWFPDANSLPCNSPRAASCVGAAAAACVSVSER